MGQKKSTPSMLNLGDHIFSNRVGFSTIMMVRIYVGDDMVIHLMGVGVKKSSSFLCPKCGYNRDRDSRIVKLVLTVSSMATAYIFEYGMPCKSPDEVIRTATEFLQGKYFGKYNFLFNNCEDFASYCKTGLRLCSQRESFVRTVRLFDAQNRTVTPILQTPVAGGVAVVD
ncbi:hypothetical protein Patl1_23224 [Pistacia atlantica]|uniref:Uncharacterized protein n=1 Tax=Pistacia atlantica TaxID=434234 RepID=A0ACC0ZVF7_9ROSI|nr:hypothetical protein Patl1_23224 [Pistacia atlantica]